LIEVKESPSGYEELYKKFEKINSFFISKDENYLQWRYFDCPDRSYKVYKLMVNDSLRGVAVLALDKKNDYIHLVDLIFDSKEIIPTFLSEVISTSTKLDFSSLSVYLNEENILAASLNEKGFKYISKKESFRFILRNLDSDSYSNNIKDPRSWFIIGGDTDFY
jgi:hypothetical protein